MKYQKINIISGWVVFAISLVVYLLTVEPTASFWDCGEFIATSYKLEVPHPPGAPLFLLIGRFFSLFAGGDVERVAYWVNIVSVLSSAFSILFLFWSITHLTKKVFKVVGDSAEDLYKVILIMGSGVVGALAFTFSDSFWFSAVEAEVYGMSSFFTAFVFWAILKWENIEDSSKSNKWLIFIAYMMGLSIGVHLLNLVAIPALGLIIYFKRNQVTTPIGILATLGISAGIIILILVGVIPGIPSLAASFEITLVNSFGLPFNSGIIFFILVLSAALIFGLWYSVKKNMINLNTFILGFMFILIGNSSYTVVLVRSGFNPPIDENDPENVLTYVSYLKREQYGNRPLFKGPHFNASPNGSERGATVYMRKGDQYVEKDFKIEYTYKPGDELFFPRMYSNQPSHVSAYRAITGVREGEKPKYSQHLAYFFKHQLGFMYFRYFMWNFAGRESDEKDANWEMFGTSSENLPLHINNNKGRNIYFGLPLFLGLIGLFFQFRRDSKNFAVTGLLFFLTGIALILYLNSPPVEPRERDYIYTGSYYAFAIWIGIGVFGVFEMLNYVIKNKVMAAGVAFAISMAIPTIMVAENWDDHDRSGRYFSVEAAKNYLDSCAPNAILFTGGDNDTFPLWYVQEVEGYRTDVRVIVLSYFNTDWYINQMMRPAYESAPIPFSLGADHYIQGGLNDAVFVAEKTTQPINARSYLNAIKTNNPSIQYNADITTYNTTPSRNMFLGVDSNKVASIIPGDMQATKRMDFSVKGRMLEKKDLAILDILVSNNWERPIYFNTTSLAQVNLTLKKYAMQEGLAFRILPVETGAQEEGVNTDVMYDNLMNNFHWKGLQDESVYFSEDYRNFCLNHRAAFGTLAENLIGKGEFDKAKAVLLKGLEVIPNKTIPYDNFNVAQIGSLLRVGATEEAYDIADVTGERAESALKYFEREKITGRDRQINLFILYQMVRDFRNAGDNERALKYEQLVEKYQ